ncbi:MAG: hypothetical protein Q9218_004120 [Villophora microphyllina]
MSWIETTKWVFFGILAPELMVFVAWRQYMSARALDRIVRGLKDQRIKSIPNMEDEKKAELSSKEYHLENPWTRLHSFYANMGGFVFDIGGTLPEERGKFTTKVPRLTLTPRGVALLAACGYLPNISTEDILDKNKSDNVSKLLSILQALWMLAQIISRLACHLPVTLLEINTLAHIMCAIIIYALWWSKPKLINEPTRLEGDWVPAIAAYMFMSSQISGWRRARPGILKKDWIDPEFSILAFEPPACREVELSAGRPCPMEAKPGFASTTFINSETPIGNMYARSTTEAGTLKRRPLLASALEGVPSERLVSTIESRLESSEDGQSVRWSLAAQAMSLYPAIGRRIICRETSEAGETVKWFEPLVEELVDDSMGNWATGNLLRDMSGFVMGMVLWSASMAYGGVHATAWNGHFPTHVEALLWRASSICIAGSGLTWILINMLARSFEWFKVYWEEVETLHAHWTSLVTLGALAFLCGWASTEGEKKQSAQHAEESQKPNQEAILPEELEKDELTDKTDME